MQNYSFGKPLPLLLNGATLREFASIFCPACSEAIFTVPLLALVSHCHQLAGAFLKQLLSSSWHLLSVTFLIYHIIILQFFVCQVELWFFNIFISHCSSTIILKKRNHCQYDVDPHTAYQSHRHNSPCP